jgi:hypothetical protein
MESAFQRGLFNQEEELNNQIDVRGMMRGDSSSRANYYASLFNMAAMSPNDVRRAEELPPLETEAADNTYIPLNNFSPLQIAAQQGLKATGEGTADEPQEAEEEPTNARKKATRKKATKKSTKARTPRPSSK